MIFLHEMCMTSIYISLPFKGPNKSLIFECRLYCTDIAISCNSYQIFTLGQFIPSSLCFNGNNGLNRKL